MYYDDVFMENIEPATRVSEYTARILDFYQEDPYLKKELKQERENFLSPRPEEYYPTSEEKESAEIGFTGYFLFSYSSSYHGKTPLEVFLSQKLSSLNRKEKEIYCGLQNFNKS